MPSTGPTDASGYGGGVVVLSGDNVAFQGGRVLQDNLSLACKYGAPGRLARGAVGGDVRSAFFREKNHDFSRFSYIPR